MTRRFLPLLVLLLLGACDTQGADRAFDLTLFTASGDVAVRLSFDRPAGEPCDGLGCGSGYADWSARDVASGFRIDRRGTLYAQETAFGAYRLALTPEVADDGIAIEIVEDTTGRISGKWFTGSIAGETLGGRVEGRVE